jgi:hypothetical protein
LFQWRRQRINRAYFQNTNQKSNYDINTRLDHAHDKDRLVNKAQIVTVLSLPHTQSFTKYNPIEKTREVTPKVHDLWTYIVQLINKTTDCYFVYHQGNRFGILVVPLGPLDIIVIVHFQHNYFHLLALPSPNNILSMFTLANFFLQ